MRRPYRLDVRLAVVVTVISALTLLGAGTILSLEFLRGQFAIEERVVRASGGMGGIASARSGRHRCV